MEKENGLLKCIKLSTNNKDSLFIMSIRKIIDNILINEMKSDKEIKTIVIASPFNNDGKSEISGYLSYQFAILGSKTLLLNLERTYTDESVFEELSLINELKEFEPVHTRINNLDYMSLNCIGTGNVLAADKNSLYSLFNRLKNEYSRIIIDTTSLKEGVSGYMAAIAADGVYYVCNRKNIHGTQIKEYYIKLKDIGANILGIIYNNARRWTVKKKYKQDGEKIWSISN